MTDVKPEPTPEGWRGSVTYSSVVKLESVKYNSETGMVTVYTPEGALLYALSRRVADSIATLMQEVGRKEQVEGRAETDTVAETLDELRKLAIEVLSYVKAGEPIDSPMQAKVRYFAYRMALHLPAFIEAVEFKRNHAIAEPRIIDGKEFDVVVAVLVDGNVYTNRARIYHTDPSVIQHTAERLADAVNRIVAEHFKGKVVD